MTNNRSYSTEIKRINASDLAPKLLSPTKPLLVDVREPNEYLEKHVKGSLHIPLSTLEFSLESPLSPAALLPPGEIYVSCRSGKRSQKAIELLQKNGVKSSLINIDGGIDGLITNSTDKSWLATQQPQ